MPMTVCLSAQVDGFALEDVRADGTLVYVSSVEGWEEGADMNVARVRRSGRHGEFALAGELEGRLVTLEGRAESPDHVSSQVLRREFGSLLASGGFAELVMQHTGDLELSATVQRLGRPSLKDVTPEIFDWRVSFLAADPFRYGVTSTGSTSFATDPVGSGLIEGEFNAAGVMDWGALPTSDGTVTVTNDGNAPAYPVFYVDGPGPVGGFRIVDVGTSERITFLGSLPSGSSLVFDTSNGSVVIDGTADRRGDSIVTGWPVIPPHSSATYLFAPESATSAAVLSVAVRATYY